MSKNQNIQHVEDLVLNGKDGIDDAKMFFSELEKIFSGQSSNKIKTSLKWDGSPSVVCGVNPENGKFFVGTKSVFNKIPKLNYTLKDIQTNHGSNKNLVWVLNLLLKYLPELNMNGIYQGDLLFWPRLVKKRIIDGEKHLVFKPNSISYAIKENSPMGKKILSSKVGIVFHTKYTGRKIKRLKPLFEPDISSFKESKNVWFIDSSFNDIKNLSETERKNIHNSLTSTSDLINVKFFEELETIPKIKIYINQYINYNVKKGISVFNSLSFMNWLIHHIENEKSKLKSQKGKESRDDTKKTIFSFIHDNKKDFNNIFVVRNILLRIKNIFIGKINSSNQNINTFFDMGKDIQRTGPEGLVISTSNGGRLVKIVDRIEFSRKNFILSERK
jgi:hypothetical protein